MSKGFQNTDDCDAINWLYLERDNFNVFSR